jgi:hypothetical protein
MGGGMSVFIVRHQHPADRCPAADFTAGAGLLNHLSPPSAARHGVRIRGEAVLAAHTLVMIAEADGEDALRAFLRPFEAAGTVEVDPASTCARVVAGGGCASILPVADPDVQALDPEEACAMNGEPLPPEHGYPLRLIVPGWYAVASVKWLTEIEVIGSPFEGFFQTERYVYETGRGGSTVCEPVRLQRVRSIITDPAAGQDIPAGDLAIRGVAWSGTAPIEKVEVSVGGGPWRIAGLVGERRSHSWQWWELLTRIDSPGRAALRARATDQAGCRQPERPEWNRLGYGGNAVHTVSVHVR